MGSKLCCCMPCFGLKPGGTPIGIGVLKLKELQDTDDFKKRYVVKMRDLDTGGELEETVTLSVSITTSEMARDIVDLEVWEFQRILAGKFRAENLSSIRGDPKHYGYLRKGTESTIEGSFSDFDAAKPSIPAHTKDEDWKQWFYTTGKGTTDTDGWQYAMTFHGPWHDSKEMTSCVRRRRWIRQFVGDRKAFQLSEEKYRQSAALQTDPSPKAGRGSLEDDMGNDRNSMLDDMDELPT